MAGRVGSELEQHHHHRKGGLPTDSMPEAGDPHASQQHDEHESHPDIGEDDQLDDADPIVLAAQEEIGSPPRASRSAGSRNTPTDAAP